MTQTKLHSWNTMGNADTQVTLPIGSYTLKSTVVDDTLTVSDVAGTVIRVGAGAFRVVIAGVFTVAYGAEPKGIELYEVTP